MYNWVLEGKITYAFPTDSCQEQLLEVNYLVCKMTTALKNGFPEIYLMPILHLKLFFSHKK